MYLQLLSDIDWPATRGLNNCCLLIDCYWKYSIIELYWLTTEKEHLILNILIDSWGVLSIIEWYWLTSNNEYIFLPLKWISSQRTFYGKRNMFTHIFLSPKCINTCVTISSKQISNILTHTFISPEHKHGWHFFQMKIFKHVHTHH